VSVPFSSFSYYFFPNKLVKDTLVIPLTDDGVAAEEDGVDIVVVVVDETLLLPGIGEVASEDDDEAVGVGGGGGEGEVTVVVFLSLFICIRDAALIIGPLPFPPFLAPES